MQVKMCARCKRVLVKENTHETQEKESAKISIDTLYMIGTASGLQSQNITSPFFKSHQKKERKKAVSTPTCLQVNLQPTVLNERHS